MGELKEFFTTMLQTYWGEGVYQYWLLFAIASILFIEKDKTKKLTYGIYSLLVLLIIFNPLSIKVLELFFAKKYTMQYFVRLFTEIPIMCVLAYGLAVLLKQSEGWNKVLLTTVLGFAIVIGGNGLYYSVDWMQKSTNITKIPDDILDICNYLHSDDDIIEVAVPIDIASYIRQIDASLVMPYGRYGSGWANLLTSDEPDVEAILEKSRSSGCDYVVVINSNKMREAFAERNLNPEYASSDYLIYHVEGVIGVKYRYNEMMQRVSVTYIDENDNIVTGSDGYATVKYEYDKEGNIVKETYYDEKDNPTALSLGQYGIHRTYDENGMVNLIMYLDKAGNPVLTTEGYYGIRREYDNEGHVLSVVYVDEHEAPMNIDNGYGAGVAYEYNENGQVEYEFYYDKNNQPVLIQDTYEGVHKEYDEKGHVKQLTYIDVDKNPVSLSGGYAAICYERDESGNNIYEYYLDAEGKPVKLPKGHYGIATEYDNKNRIKKVWYMDQNRNPVLISGGYAYIEYYYNDDNTVREKIYYDLNNKKIEID